MRGDISNNFIQGINGPIKFSGFSPELDEFTIRIVDGKFP